MSAIVIPDALRHPPKPLPLLPMLRQLVRNPLEAWPESVFSERIVATSAFGRQTVTILDPDMIRTVLVDEADAFRKGDILVRTLAPALGRGILTSDGADWRWQRRAAAPVFRHERIAGFLPAILAAAEETASAWEARGDGAPVDVAEEMMRTTFAIIVATMLSGEGDIDVGGVAEAITAYLEPVGWQVALSVLNAPQWLPYPGRRRARAARLLLRATLARVIAARRRGGKAPGAEPGDDLLALLIAAEDATTGRRMDDEALADNLLTFITAGHETTALALTWALWLLAHAPEAEARVLDEIEAATGGEQLDATSVAGLTFTRQVVQEAMRLYPPAPIIAREALRGVRVGPVAVEQGARVQVPVYVVHRHRALWERPDAFDPDRFAPEAAAARHRYAYLPFGAGPRICIGMGFAMLEATAILATLVRRTRLTAEPGHVPHPVLRITLRPEGGMPMRVSARSRSTPPIAAGRSSPAARRS